jgi:pimeloyl-ACP methyl ester carboxylesterase
MKGKLVTPALAVLLLANAMSGERSDAQIVSADPGIYQIGNGPDGKPGIQFEEIAGSSPFLTFDAIPKAALGNTGSIDDIMCHALPVPACVLHVADKQSAIRLLTRSNAAWEASPQRLDVPSFFSFTRKNIRFTSDTMFVAVNPLTVKGQIVRWRLSDPSRQIAVPLADNQFAALYPVYNSRTIVGFANVQTVSQQVLASDYQPSQWWIFRKDGKIDRLSSIPGCRPQAISHDVIICDGEASASAGSKDDFSVHLTTAGDYRVAVLTPGSPNNAIDDNFFDPRTPIRVLGADLIFDGFVDGVKRPFRIDWSTMMVRPLLARTCFKDRGSEVHVSATGSTSDGRAAMFWSFGPLTPSTYSLLNDTDLRLGKCPSAGRILPGGKATFDPAGMHVSRGVTGVRHVPYTLISGHGDGPAKDKLLTFVYGVDGLWLPEQYLGDWGSAWVARGGSIAFVHVRGGGGFGETWHLSGVGAAGKEGAVADLIDFAEEYRARSRNGKADIGLYAESGGGIVASVAALRRPDLFSAVALRAGCFSLNRQRRTGCTIRDEFGKVDDPRDAEPMARLSPSDLASHIQDAPDFLFLVPQYDNVVLRDDLLAGASKLPLPRRHIRNLPGVNHTGELPDLQEKALKIEIADFYIAVFAKAKIAQSAR